MPIADLGQARDKITAITRTQGDGTAGTMDTYTVYTECSPNGAGTFQVRNGSDGYAPRFSYRSLYDSMASNSSGDLYNALDEIGMSNIVAIYFASSAGTTFPYGLPNNPVWDSAAIEITLNSAVDLGGVGPSADTGNHYISSYKIYDKSGNQLTQSVAGYVYFFNIIYIDNSEGVTIDNELDRASHNVIENMAVAKAVSVGVYTTSLALAENDSYATDAGLVSAVANGFPFTKGGVVYKMVHAYTDNMEYEGVELSSGNMKRTIIDFNTNTKVVSSALVIEMASSADISNIF